MAVYYLKNSTGSEIEVGDLGLVITDGQSVTIDQNDFDGYLTDGMTAALGASPASGLVLSTTDVGDSSGDFTKPIAIERLSMTTDWKNPVANFVSLPISGNVDGDVRLVKGEGILYTWKAAGAQWIKTSTVYQLTITDYDGSPSSDAINQLVFVDAEDQPFIKGSTAYIGAPSAPSGLGGLPLTIGGSNLYSAGLSTGNTNYKAGNAAGSVVSYDTNDGTFMLAIPASNLADLGTVSAYLNGARLATVDLAANFNEANREGAQTIANYNTTGTGDPVSGGVANFVDPNAGKGSLQVLSVGMTNGFKYYQTFSARVNVTDTTLLRQGYNSFYVVHGGLATSGGDQQSATFDLFYDTDSGANPSVPSITLTEGTPVYGHLSGVKFYKAGSTWTVAASVNDAFDNVFHSSGAPLVLSGWPGLSSTVVSYNDSHSSGVSNPPNIGETMTVAGYVLTQAAGSSSANARLTATPRDPYGSYSTATSSSDNILVYSFAEASTDLVEMFRDEQHRLPATPAYSTIPANITGQWDSTQALGGYDGDAGLQVYMSALAFPTLNFSSGYCPAGNPDYSPLASTSDRVFVRAFRSASGSHANGTLRLTGVTKAQLQARAIRAWIKAPSQTGWLDLTVDYNYPIFTGADNDGCWVGRDTQSNSDFQFTLGSFYTQNSGNMVIVKVQYPSSAAPVITYMGITDW